MKPIVYSGQAYFLIHF